MTLDGSLKPPKSSGSVAFSKEVRVDELRISRSTAITLDFSSCLRVIKLDTTMVPQFPALVDFKM